MLSRFSVSGKWLQTYLEVVEYPLLVGLRRGDFMEFYSSHEYLLLADCGQSLNDVSEGPLSIFVGAVCGKERLQALLEVPLQIVGQGAKEHVASDPVIGFVKDGSHFELHGFEIAKSLLDQTQLFIRSNHFGGGHLLPGQLRTHNVTTVKESFGSDLVLIKVP